jgi:hypothetical protein
MRLLAVALLAVFAPSLALAGSTQSPSACARDPAACERASNLRRPSDYGKALGGVKTPEPRERPPRPRVVVIVVPEGSVDTDHESSMREEPGDGVLDEAPEAQ